MRLEKGMKLTQIRSFKNFAMNLYEDDMGEWAWGIADIVNNKDKRLFSVVREPNMGVMIDEEALTYFFTPWCDWRRSPDGFEYKTNGRLVFVRQKQGEEYVKAKATCHALDTFDLEKGIEIARGRLELKMAQRIMRGISKPFGGYGLDEPDNPSYLSTSKYNSNKIVGVGSVFGDLEVISYEGKDSSRHNLWKCKCLVCGNEIVMRSTNLRKATIGCNKCKNKKRPIKSDTMKNFIDKNLVWGSVDNTIKNNIINNHSVLDKLTKTPLTIKNENNNSFDFATEFEWTNGHFALRETTGNLLEAPCYNCVLHVVSADYEQEGAIGITKDVIDKFGIQEDIIEEIEFLKRCADYDSEARVLGEVISYYNNVLSLVVKNSKYDKVAYHTIARGLRNLKRVVKNRKINYLSMPRICCGREKLDWTIVRKMIIDEFQNVGHDLTITVYHK